MACDVDPFSVETYVRASCPLAFGDGTAYGVGVNLSCGAAWCCGQSSLPCVDMKDNGSGSILSANKMEILLFEILSAKKAKNRFDC